MIQMTDAAPKAIAVQKAVDAVMRKDRGRLLAGLTSQLRDLQLAEDALQDAAISALGHWGRSGIPHAPTAWLMKVAKRKAIDRIRTKTRESQKAQDFGQISDAVFQGSDPEEIPDERLRLIFTCCHPTLEEKSRVALTLRTVCTLTTREIAAAFLDTDMAMGQRLSRAKAKLKAEAVGFLVPDPAEWPQRLDTVLSTLYLIFTTGYIREDTSPRDLCGEAIYLARLLDRLQPEDPEIKGALALLLLTEARRAARISPTGSSVPIEAQDRALWQAKLIAQGQGLLERAVAARQPGPFQIKAAITDCHMANPGPDWAQMSFLYQSLWSFEPTPIVALNWAVVLAEIGFASEALEKLESLEQELANFQPWHAARASILHKLGRSEHAIATYHIAIEGAQTDASRRFLLGKLSQIEGGN